QTSNKPKPERPFGHVAAKVSNQSIRGHRFVRWPQRQHQRETTLSAAINRTHTVLHEDAAPRTAEVAAIIALVKAPFPGSRRNVSLTMLVRCRRPDEPSRGPNI
ncbi:MAG: hypothetical protein KDJ31_05220, partial [Candidatus Competibacteraceae bacterium]|nr:hypothetical protein [Candidatus Competibacteraceae bacterium]